MSWYLAPALRVLINQVNAAAPKRSKRTDGTIGDLAHSLSKSEHNPNAQGAVRAWDCTHDPNGGVDCFKLSEDVIREMDKRGIEGYVIFRGRIRSTTTAPGVWRTYRGANPHNHHMHVSVITGWKSEAMWSLPSLSNAVIAVVDPGVLQVDGDLGRRSKDRFASIMGMHSYTERSWWTAAQLWAGLTGKDVDGIEGPRTWAAIAAKLGSRSGKVDGIVRAWQTWMNAQRGGMPVVVPGKPAQDAAVSKPPVVIVPGKNAQDAPPWRLPKGHLIFHDPGRRASWHDGASDDPVGRSMIEQFQRQMKSRGWKIAVTGRFDKATENVVRLFQKEKRLGADGIIGPETWKAAWSLPVT